MNTKLAIDQILHLVILFYQIHNAHNWRSDWSSAKKPFSKTGSEESQPGSEGDQTGNGNGSGRSSGFFNLFTVVKVTTAPCTGAATIRSGTCYGYANCVEKGGYTDGSCSNGYGVCCLFYADTCGSNIYENSTYLRNPNYPSSYTSTTSMTCKYTVFKSSSNICQIRLDFEIFTLSDPNRDSSGSTAAGTCITDKLTFVTSSGYGSLVPTICGAETGQHLFLDVGSEDTGYVVLTFEINAASPNSDGRLWSIRAAQVPCDQNYRAPIGCLQHFTGLTNTVKSLNFDSSTSPQFLIGTYDVCVRKEKGYCQLCWQATGETNAFQTDSTTAAGAATLANCPATISRVFIYASSIGGTGTPQDIYCGGALNPAYLCTKSSKLTIDFVGPPTMAAGSGDAQRGVALEYRQIPC